MYHASKTKRRERERIEAASSASFEEAITHFLTFFALLLNCRLSHGMLTHKHPSGCLLWSQDAAVMQSSCFEGKKCLVAPSCHPSSHFLWRSLSSDIRCRQSLRYTAFRLPTTALSCRCRSLLIADSDRWSTNWSAAGVTQRPALEYEDKEIGFQSGKS